METKIITTSFDDRADVHWPTATLQCELESIEDAFRDCNSKLSGAEMPPLTYSFQADAISEMTENMLKLQVYASTAREQIYLELDNPLYQHFKDNATETLSQIILDEITTDNTIGMEEYYEVAGKGKVYGRKRVKKNLTMRDFLGLQEITPESGMPVLENVETIGEFASMFRKDYDIMTSMYVDVNACIEAYMTSGEYNHHAYHPIGDMLSGVLDITVIKPIIECFTGTDLITGERLTEMEKAWKAVGAAIDAITFGQGTTALKGVKLFSTEAFETIGRTFMWDLVSESAAYGINYAGQQIGMPEGFNWILTAATGMTVSMAGDKFILEGVDGTKIKKSFKEMKEWLVEKLKKSEGGSNADTFDYYMDLVETLDVSTAPNTATFYSGPGNRALAEEFAKINGKVTLETTPGGAYLDDLKLFEAGSPLTKEEATNVWARLSARYAQNASGNAYGFVNGSWPESIFNTVEYPELLKNPNITNVFTEFMN